MDTPLWMWVAFLGIVTILLLLDLGVFNKTDHEIGVRESLRLSIFYVVIALLFGAWVWYTKGAIGGQEYLAGYLVEKTLSIDNIFVISMIFTHFKIPRIYQHRVLFWGIIGVIVLRGIMIGLGAALVHNYAWILYVFGAFLVFTGIKMLFVAEKKDDLANSFIISFVSRHLHVTKELHGNKFFVSIVDSKLAKKIIRPTPLFVTLLFIEFADVIFAIDSVPAIFALTTDTYIIYTSNIFAILGLRSLYFALAAILYRFEYLRYALSLVLIFIGSKVFIVHMLGWESFPISISLAITIALICGGMLFSIYKTRDKMF